MHAIDIDTINTGNTGKVSMNYDDEVFFSQYFPPNTFNVLHKCFSTYYFNANSWFLKYLYYILICKMLYTFSLL